MKKYEDIGNRLKVLRGDFTQVEVSKRIGIALLSYQRYESGERVPKGDVLQRISVLYNETTDYILTGKKPVTLYDFLISKAPPEKQAAIRLILEKLQALPSKVDEWSLSLEDALKLVEKEIASESVAEPPAKPYGIVRGKINELLDSMDEEAQRDVLKYAEKEKLFAELKSERKLKEG